MGCVWEKFWFSRFLVKGMTLQLIYLIPYGRLSCNYGNSVPRSHYDYLQTNFKSPELPGFYPGYMRY